MRKVLIILAVSSLFGLSACTDNGSVMVHARSDNSSARQDDGDTGADDGDTGEDDGDTGADDGDTGADDGDTGEDDMTAIPARMTARPAKMTARPARMVNVRMPVVKVNRCVRGRNRSSRVKIRMAIVVWNGFMKHAQRGRYARVANVLTRRNPVRASVMKAGNVQMALRIGNARTWGTAARSGS